MRNEALDSRDQVGVAQGHQSHDHLVVGLGGLESFVCHARILGAGAQSVGGASDHDQV